MKIAVSAKGNTMDSLMDQRFGRAASFILVDTQTMNFEALNNVGAAASGGAGIAAAQMVAEKDVKAIITGNVGPNAMNVLKAAKIEIYKGSEDTVQKNVEFFKTGLLEKINTTVPSHFGLRG